MNKITIATLVRYAYDQASYDTVRFGECINYPKAGEIFAQFGIPYRMEFRRGNAVVPDTGRGIVVGKYTPQQAKRAFAIYATLIQKENALALARKVNDLVFGKAWERQKYPINTSKECLLTELTYWQFCHVRASSLPEALVELGLPNFDALVARLVEFNYLRVKEPTPMVVESLHRDQELNAAYKTFAALRLAEQLAIAQCCQSGETHDWLSSLSPEVREHFIQVCKAPRAYHDRKEGIIHTGNIYAVISPFTPVTSTKSLLGLYGWFLHKPQDSGGRLFAIAEFAVATTDRADAAVRLVKLLAA